MYDIREIYGNPPIFKQLDWPSKSYCINPKEDAHWVIASKEMIYVVALISQFNHLLEKGVITEKTRSAFAFDLSEACCRLMNRPPNEPLNEVGKYGQVYGPLFI